MEETPSHGERAYNGYRASTGGKTYDGHDIPDWKHLGVRIQTAWEAAADAVLEPYYGQDCL